MNRIRLFAVVLLAAACTDGSQSSEVASHEAAMDFAVSAPAAAPPPPSPQSLVAKGATAGIARQVATRSGSGNAAVPSGGAALPGGDAIKQSSAIIRTGNASVEVKQLDTAVARVRGLAEELGGYVANTSMHGGNDQVPAATLELKLPAARFDQAITALEPVGSVESVNVEAQDVGEELVDLEARIANARRLEARLVELLSTRTGRLEDVLAVERELARVREEIERAEGRLRYLQSRVAVSTLVVSLHEPRPILGRTDNPIAEAVQDAWRNFVGAVAFMIASLGVVIPVVLVGSAVTLAARRLMRRRGAVNRTGTPGVAY